MIFYITCPNYHLKRQLQLRRNQIVRERTLDRIPHCQNSSSEVFWSYHQNNIEIANSCLLML
jgi:hypothetical protein